MRALMLLLGVALAPPALADDARQPLPPIRAAAPWMTGAQLLRKLDNPAEAAEAIGYIKAVVDVTADREWCYSQARPGSAQLQPALTEKLRALSPAQAQRSAAALAVEAWRERWPCPAAGCCHA
jgi:hypothetical protein